MIKRWKRFQKLSSLERGIVLEAAGGLLATWVGLRLIGFRRWEHLLAVLVPSVSATGAVRGASDHEPALLIARMQEAAARNLFIRTNCLERSLVLCWLLRRRGMVAELRIGVRKDSDRFEAHAWVERNSQVLNDASEEHRHFVPFEKPVLSMGVRIE
ncbi:MAG: lasso peptide biosynthesis B2 protein [Candidatus Acidiferrales bacterium]